MSLVNERYWLFIFLQNLFAAVWQQNFVKIKNYLFQILKKSVANQIICYLQGGLPKVLQ